MSRYPSPASSELTIELEQEVDAASMEILDNQGKVVRTLRLSGVREVLDVSGLSPGMYWIRVVHGTGSLSTTFQVE